MDADEYFQAYDALAKDKHKSRIALRIGDTCGITQIIWSTFDYMTGPELRFVWDVTPSNESLTPIDLSGDEEPSGSGADDESLDSSMTNSSIQFEEIDDVLQTDLSILDEVISGNTSLSRFLDDFMSESRVSEQSGTRTIDALTDSFASSAHVGLPLDESTDSFDSLKAQAMMGDLPLAASSPQESLTQIDRNYDRVSRSHPSQSSCSTATTAKSTMFELEREDNLFEEDETDLLTSGYVGSEMMESHDDLPFSPFSMVSPGIKPHSDSAATPFNLKRPSSPSSSSSDLYIDDVTLDVHDDLPSDELFIAKFVLAEQICSTQLSSNPLVHKMMVVPSRRIAVSSFLFASSEGSAVKKGAMHALSIVMKDKRYRWYMDRHDTFDGIITDIVPRMKASFLAEEVEDTVVRLTSEWSKLLSVMGTLERFPLLPRNSSLKIKRTFFSSPSLPSSLSPLISRAISACLQSQGNCVVVGSNLSTINKLLHTLLLFIPPSLRWSCARPYTHEYSPLLRLQAVKRSALSTVLHNAIFSPWPISIIDMDRSIVLVSTPYPKHAVIKRRAELSIVNSILGEMGDSSKKGKTLELSRVRRIDAVLSFLRRIALLPTEDSARLGFVDQFNLCVDNAARSFIAYVKDASEPVEKAHASRSPSFSLTTTRKALDLTQDCWFYSVLARAELLQPEITQFVYM
ncbi:hypothetical protein PFISCL1PPCAC_6383 [Pristionchus fissidentatus]|uniref:UDENN domain-containing protein n=1 Tax=Pristionchus fissidentatus TaxID=1538716 RepID=A0AAV5V6S5_9BILA|nr:hypothetical protein PFISCL1PPCAC_6383 [Pristionchus fissidentatus]